METYRAILLPGRGGPEVYQTVDLPLVAPATGEVRVAIRAVGAGATDVTMRRGRYPYAPKYPFVPGYEAVGTVEAVGEGVTDLRVGDRVAALLVHGGYAEKLVRPADTFVKVPDGLDDADAVALILNYVTAYQAIHRAAKVTAGQTALVDGANGGVGTALLELLRVAGVKVYAAAGRRHHASLEALGAVPIDGRDQPIDVALRNVCPEGVDASFDALGGRFAGQCRRATRRGGVVVGYGFSGTYVHGAPRTWDTLRGFASLLVGSPLTGKRGTFYGITLLYRRDPKPFRDDLVTLFDLLAAGRIRPPIAARLPLLDIRRAAELIEGGGLQGKIVHLASVTA